MASRLLAGGRSTHLLYNPVSRGFRAPFSQSGFGFVPNTRRVSVATGGTTSVCASEKTPRERKYPGWGLDLRWTVQEHCDYFETGLYPAGTHHNCFGADSEMLPVREVAMMMVMDMVTDKPDWHRKIYDDEIVNKWRKEALSWPNGDLYEHIRTHHGFDGDGIAMPKDNILNDAAIEYCIQELREKAEYFRKTRIIPTLDATYSIAKSDTIVPKEVHSALREAFHRLKAEQGCNPDWHPNTNDTVQDLVHPSLYPLVYGKSRFIEGEVVGIEDALSWAGEGDIISPPPSELAKRHMDYGIGGGSIDPSYWSTKYQWLPANLAFTPDGGVKFTSYISNLHPIHHRDIYTTLESLISTSAIPMWDQCLALYHGHNMLSGPGRRTPRLKPADPTLNSDSNPRNWDPGSPTELLRLQGYTPQQIQHYLENDKDDLLEEQWHTLRKALHPPVPPFSPSISYAPNPTQTLRALYTSTGLQVIIKLASLELSPSKPVSPPGEWHVEGLMNEHIIATALYYLDCENITDVRLDFQTLTSAYQDEYEESVGQDGYHWMNSVYGTSLGCGAGGECVQRYGGVVTREGRMVAFPNVFQHRVGEASLVDGRRGGYRRFVAVWLVDPMVRVISTANVPPQQGSWVGEKGMEREEAEGYRRRLMEERSVGAGGKGGYVSASYNFCEH